MNKKEKQELYMLEKKSKSTAVFLSLLIVGAGQIYAKEYAKGLFFFVLTIALWFVLMGWIMWILAPIDAYASIKKYNRKLELKLGL